MTEDAVCPQCGEELEVEEWEEGQCPACGLSYWWDSEEEYDDRDRTVVAYSLLTWEDY